MMIDLNKEQRKKEGLGSGFNDMMMYGYLIICFFFQAEDGIRDC